MNMRGKTQTLKGFRDFLPERMAVRNEVVRRLRSVFERYGFEELMTPAMEYQEVLLGKYGEEAEKLMYLFRDAGGRDIGLRYDLTVPMARVCAQYRDLPIPFKRYQIQPVWRADKPQKGRYREIYQCDIDTVGSPSALADAEIIAIISSSLRELGFEKFKIRVNSRTVLFGIMKNARVPGKLVLPAIQAIDKLDKKTKDEVTGELLDKGLDGTTVNKIFSEIKRAKPDKFLSEAVELASKLGARNITFDPFLSRGLDYYTGPVFESVVEKPKLGSITGGGRYDKLLRQLGGPDLPATGSTIGLDRVCDVIEELGLWKEMGKSTTKVLVTVFNDKLLSESIKLANILRGAGANAELYPEGVVKLEKQLKYADRKQAKWVAIIGPDEAGDKMVMFKNMESGEQKRVGIEEAASFDLS